MLKELPPLPDDLLASGEASKSTDNIPKQTPPQRSLIQRLLAHWTTLSLPVVAAAAWMFMIYQPKQPSYTELPPPTAKNKGTKTPEKRASHEISFTLKIEHGPMLSMDENEYLLRKLIRARFQYTSTFKKSLYTVVFMSDEKGLLTRLYPGTEEGVLKLKSSDYANLKRFVTIAPGSGPERIYVCASRQPIHYTKIREVLTQTVGKTPLKQLKRLPLPCLHQQSWLFIPTNQRP